MIKVLLFDWDGVLGDECNTVGSQYFAKKYGLHFEEVYSLVDGIDLDYSSGEEPDEYFKIISEKFSLPIEELKSKMTEINKLPHYDAIISLPIKKAVLTNQMKPRTEKMKEFHKDFDYFFSSWSIKLKKPSKEVYEYVLKEMKCTPEEVLFVDDKRRNTLVAEGLGMQVVTLEDPNKLMDLIKEKVSLD